MSSKLLVSAERLMLWLGIRDTDNIEIDQETLEEALKAAQTKLEAKLDTGFQLSTRSDIFYLNKQAYRGPVPEMHKLLLTNGFVKDATVSIGDNWKGQNFIQLEDSEFVLNKEQGLIITEGGTNFPYVRVDYSAGLTSQTVPEWLQVGILAQAPLLFGLPENLPDTRGAKNFTAQIEAMYSAHNRIIPFAERAMFTWES